MWRGLETLRLTGNYEQAPRLERETRALVTLKVCVVVYFTCIAVLWQFCGSVRCSVLQCVAVCCSAPHRERNLRAYYVEGMCCSVCNTKRCDDDDATTKEPYISTKEPYILAKEPYISAKSPVFSQNAAAMMTLQHTATHCNALQHTAIHCNTLQYTATHCNTKRCSDDDTTG